MKVAWDGHRERVSEPKDQTEHGLQSWSYLAVPTSLFIGPQSQMAPGSDLSPAHSPGLWGHPMNRGCSCQYRAQLRLKSLVQGILSFTAQGVCSGLQLQPAADISFLCPAQVPRSPGRCPELTSVLPGSLLPQFPASASIQHPRLSSRSVPTS